MTARSDLLALLSLPRATKKQRSARVVAALRAHEDAVVAACAGFVFDPFDGDDAAAAWRWVKGVEAVAKTAAASARRALPLRISWLADHWEVDVVDGKRGMSLVQYGGDAFFRRLLPRPNVTRARALLAVPHDVRSAGQTAFFDARPPKSAPLGRRVAWLHDQRFGPFQDAVKRELDDIAVDAIEAVTALDLGGATPIARWQRLSSSLKASNLSLWLDVKPRSIAIDAEVWIGTPARGWWGPAVVSAVERLLTRSGSSPAGIAAHFEEVSASARPTRSLWIERELHQSRAHPWKFARPAAKKTAAATKKKKKAPKKKATKKKATKKKAKKKV